MVQLSSKSTQVLPTLMQRDKYSQKRDRHTERPTRKFVLAQVLKFSNVSSKECDAEAADRAEWMDGGGL